MWTASHPGQEEATNTGTRAASMDPFHTLATPVHRLHHSSARRGGSFSALDFRETNHSQISVSSPAAREEGRWAGRQDTDACMIRGLTAGQSTSRPPFRGIEFRQYIRLRGRVLTSPRG